MSLFNVTSNVNLNRIPWIRSLSLMLYLMLRQSLSIFAYVKFLEFLYYALLLSLWSLEAPIFSLQPYCITLEIFFVQCINKILRRQQCKERDKTEINSYCIKYKTVKRIEIIFFLISCISGSRFSWGRTRCLDYTSSCQRGILRLKF